MGIARSGNSQTPDLPHVHLLATGGTIAGGATGALDAEDFTKLIPELDRIAKLTVEDFSNIGSSRMTPELQFQLAGRVNELFGSQPGLSGVVITHGTDSLEETAFFLDLLISSDRPVIFAAAQRPPRMTDSDGPRNLLNAIRLAAASASREMGVLITLNDEIHAAREVRKEHSIALDAFRSSWTGPVGTVDSGRIYFFRKPLRRLTLSVSSIEPRVDLITLVAGSDGHLVRAAVSSGAKGIVVEVFGRGNVPPKVMEAVEEARKKDVVVVFTTRTRGGRVVLNSSARDLGIISAEDLDGLKARMLLVAALGEVHDLKTLSAYFRKLSGEIESGTDLSSN
jgi:L-asparaginase